jgi:hypothetical protein
MGADVVSEIEWTDDLKAACGRAAKSGKLVLLDFFSPT